MRSNNFLRLTQFIDEGAFVNERFIFCDLYCDLYLVFLNANNSNASDVFIFPAMALPEAHMPPPRLYSSAQGLMNLDKLEHALSTVLNSQSQVISVQWSKNPRDYLAYMQAEGTLATYRISIRNHNSDEFNCKFQLVIPKYARVLRGQAQINDCELVRTTSKTPLDLNGAWTIESAEFMELPRPEFFLECYDAAYAKLKRQAEGANLQFIEHSVQLTDIDNRVLNPSAFLWFSAQVRGLDGEVSTISKLTQKRLGSSCF